MSPDSNIEANDSTTAAGEAFIARYGEMRSILRADNEPVRASDGRLWDDLTALERVYVVADWFRRMLTAKTEMDIFNAGRILDVIFAAYVSEEPKRVPPAVRANYATGGFDPAPRDLLDSLALELLRSHQQIARCAWDKCGRWFIKSYPLDKYCGYPRNCGLKARREAQAQWMRDYRKPKTKKKGK